MAGAIQNSVTGANFGLQPATTSRATEVSGRNQAVQLQPDALELSGLVDDEISMAVAGMATKSLKKRETRSTSRLGKAAEEDAEKASEESQGLLSVGELVSVFEKASSTLVHDELSLLAEIERDFRDPSQQECALKFLEEFLEKQGLDPELRKAIHQKRSEIQHEFGESVRADFNVQPKASQFENQGLGSASALRSFYRSHVIGYRGPEDVLARIRQQFGEPRMQQALEFLIQGLGAELHSATPSIPIEHLKAIIDDLSIVEATRNLELSLRDSLARASGSFGFAAPQNTSSMLNGLLNLRKQRWIDSSEVDRILSDTGARTIEEKLYMARELRQIVRELPGTIFTDRDEHGRMNDAMQAAMDRLIEREGGIR